MRHWFVLLHLKGGLCKSIEMKSFIEKETSWRSYAKKLKAKALSLVHLWEGMPGRRGWRMEGGWWVGVGGLRGVTKGSWKVHLQGSHRKHVLEAGVMKCGQQEPRRRGSWRPQWTPDSSRWMPSSQGLGMQKALQSHFVRCLFLLKSRMEGHRAGEGRTDKKWRGWI